MASRLGWPVFVAVAVGDAAVDDAVGIDSFGEMTEFGLISIYFVGQIMAIDNQIND